MAGVSFVDSIDKDLLLVQGSIDRSVFSLFFLTFKVDRWLVSRPFLLPPLQVVKKLQELGKYLENMEVRIFPLMQKGGLVNLSRVQPE